MISGLIEDNNGLNDRKVIAYALNFAGIKGEKGYG